MISYRRVTFFLFLFMQTRVLGVQILRNLKDKTMANKLMNIPNNNSQNYHFLSLPVVVETYGQ